MKSVTKAENFKADMTFEDGVLRPKLKLIVKVEIWLESK